MPIAMGFDEYSIRTMTRDDIDTAIEWTAHEGWNPGLDDAASFHAADPEGFLVGVLDDEIAATISVVRYGTTFGFLGLYIDRRVVPLSSLPFDTVAAYDRLGFPAEREEFLRCWIHQPRGNAFGFVRDGQLAGYGVIRPARNGFKIGPLFADDAAVAEALFDALAASIPQSSTLCLDVPDVNPAAVALAERRRTSVVFETARMYAGPMPDISLHRVFGVTTFELG